MKKLFTTLLLLAGSLISFAQKAGWIDVTDQYIINPRYDNNDLSGWWGTQLGAYNPKENAEHYQKNYDTYQYLYGLQAGKYRLSLNAFYRIGSADNDYNLFTSGNYRANQHAQLYANSSVGSYSTPISPASFGRVTSSLGGDASPVGNVHWDWSTNSNVGDYYIPNNMVAADLWFQAGYYMNTLDCQVGDNGELTIGISKYTTINGDWTCIDNWKLEQWGTVTLATSIVLSETSLNMVPTEIHDLTATVLPTDATYRNVAWSTTNPSVATVDSKGQITAVGEGTCDIVATAKDESGVSEHCHITVEMTDLSEGIIIINEIMAANVDVYLDPSQNYGSWVELYNPSDKGIKLGGLYVTDDPENLTKHRLIDSYGALPAHGYALLNFDHFEVFTPYSLRQIDDKLDCDGGTIIISDGTTILAQQDYEPAISRISYARTTDGGDTWGTTSKPSPGYSNEVNGGFAEMQLDAPIVDKDAQLFTGVLSVCVNIPEGATLKYTTDGTAPTETNGDVSETGLFAVRDNTCYRFRLFQDGYLPSTVVTRTYLYDRNEEPFPIISVVTDPNNIYDYNYGVFQSGGEYGRPGNGRSDKCNWNMPWDRPVAFEFITTDNECIVSQECDFSMCGGWTRSRTPHSFKLKAKKTYDLMNYFPASFFDKKPYIKSKTLQIRNGGNDTSCRIKDPSLQQIIARSGIDVDYQEWQPVHVYINGQSYAVLNMREPNNKDFAYSNFGIDTDEMDQFEISPDSSYVQMRGTDEAFLHLVDLSENAADADTYEEIRQLLDIDEFINYMTAELYLAGNDWPRNNLKGYRDINNGKFRMVLFDLDNTLAVDDPLTDFFNKEMWEFDELYGINYATGENFTGQKLKLPIKIVTLLKNLLQNDAFRKQFIDTYCIMGGSVFQPKYVTSIINEMAATLSQGGYVDPYSTANYLINKLSTTSYNDNITSRMKNCSHLQLWGVNRQQANISANISEADILFNGIRLPYTEFNGYVYAPVTLKAVAPTGYRFVGWKNTGGGTMMKTLFGKGSDWKYYDKGSLDNKSWKATTYNDASWSEGPAIIGYDNNNMHPDIVTNTEGYRPTYYFRKTVTLDDAPSDDDIFQLDYTIDDGLIIYVNGTEAGRYNMPSGTVTYNTYATTYAYDNPATGTMTLPANLFREGDNLIAVEVHNNSASSTDIMWDAALSLSTTNVITDEEYTLPTSGTQQVQALFEAITADEMLAEGITPVRINEVSAANSIYINDSYKKNDWIELINTTDADINIAGMYISDNVKKPNKYQVPTNNAALNTIIPAHGYKIIWCDKLDNKTDIHTSFKLSAEGGDVVISKDGYQDVLTYTAHTGVQTFGRYPDGANDTYLMNIPTISKANRLGSYDERYIEPEPIPDDIRTYTKEGGLTIAYVGGAVNVKSEDDAIRSVSIYNISGIRVASSQFTSRQFVTVPVSTLPRGIYIAHATTETGDECHIKFIIK